MPHKVVKNYLVTLNKVQPNIYLNEGILHVNKEYIKY